MIHCKYNANIRGLVSCNFLERTHSLLVQIHYSARMGNGNESEKKVRRRRRCRENIEWGKKSKATIQPIVPHTGIDLFIHINIHM